MKVGDTVKFTGHGYRRAIAFRYEEMFGERQYKIEDIRTSCCNTFIMLEGIDGMFSEKFFTKIPPTPYIPHSKGETVQRGRGKTQPR